MSDQEYEPRLGAKKASFRGEALKRPPDLRSTRVRVTIAAAISLGLVLGGATVAGAAGQGYPSGQGPPNGQAQGHGWHPAVMGTVASVGSATFTVTTSSGSRVTVDVSNATSYRDPGVTSPTFANVTTGQHVFVMGTTSSGTVAATAVFIGTPRSGGIAAPVGFVASAPRLWARWHQSVAPRSR